MSKPRPIPITRTLRSAPDEAEPSFSFEEESFLSNNRALDFEDDFHRRLTSTGVRREESGGASFWRATSTGVNNAVNSPSFNSVNLRGESDVNGKERTANVAHAQTPPRPTAKAASAESSATNTVRFRLDLFVCFFSWKISLGVFSFSF